MRDICWLCQILQQMIARWVSTPDVILWWIDTFSDGRGFCWLFFFLLHTAAWCVLFLQVAVMDPLELIGVKQVTAACISCVYLSQAVDVF